MFDLNGIPSGYKDWQKVEFTRDGTIIFPAGVSTALFHGCGGGGGGGSAGGSLGSAASGGSASAYPMVIRDVVPGSIYRVQVGIPGAGGPGTNSNGSPGGDTIVTDAQGNVVLKLLGGLGGLFDATTVGAASPGANSLGGAGGGGGQNGGAGGHAKNGNPTFLDGRYVGGIHGTDTGIGFGGGGGGGASEFGNGGDGGTTSTTSPTDGQGYGAGGGGSAQGLVGDGGNGAQGYLAIYFIPVN